MEFPARVLERKDPD